PVAWVGKTPLRPLARPQDRSGSPTKGAKLTGGNLPDCRRKRPNTHQPTTNTNNSQCPLKVKIQVDIKKF
ncbi:MAG: hypothetical protein ACHBN1_09090, partial [Heteroscytonema crispum UTEX LB 1556]